jgi:hypothetical protein
MGMGGAIVIMFLLSLFFLLGFLKSMLAFQRPRIYPSKYVLKQRLTMFGSGSAICLALAIILMLLF